MQCFRLMNLPDRVIAFDELPENLVKDFEMCRADGFPRHWKEWLGKKQKVTHIPPEKDFLTGQVRHFKPIVEEDSFFYMVDWNIQPQVEKWQEVCDYVRANVDKETRLKEKITDMAVKLGANKSSGIDLDPEDVPVIKLPKPISIIDEKGQEKVLRGSIKSEKESVKIKCEECNFEAEGQYAKTSVRMHKMKKHPKPVEAAPAAQ